MYHNAWGGPIPTNPRLSIQQVTVPTAVNSKQYTVQYSTFDASGDRLPPPPPAGAASDRGKGGGGQGHKRRRRRVMSGDCKFASPPLPPFSAGAEGPNASSHFPGKQGKEKKGREGTVVVVGRWGEEEKVVPSSPLPPSLQNYLHIFIQPPPPPYPFSLRLATTKHAPRCSLS